MLDTIAVNTLNPNTQFPAHLHPSKKSVKLHGNLAKNNLEYFLSDVWLVHFKK